LAQLSHIGTLDSDQDMFTEYSIDLSLYRYVAMNGFQLKSGNTFPLFWLSSENAISSKISPCHHATRSNQTRQRPS
jgi:hypothetical protein